MKSLTIRKSVKQDIAQQIPSLIESATAWMQYWYPSIDFNVDYIFSSSYNRSRYFPNRQGDKYTTPCVCISTRGLLMLYNRPSLGMKKTSVYTGSTIQMMSSLIHELTHHVQYQTGIRMGNETDTTRNELLYLAEHEPEVYQEFITA
jgi:hypothetical protein